MPQEGRAWTPSSESAKYEPVKRTSFFQFDSHFLPSLFFCCFVDISCSINAAIGMAFFQDLTITSNILNRSSAFNSCGSLAGIMIISPDLTSYHWPDTPMAAFPSKT